MRLAGRGAAGLRGFGAARRSDVDGRQYLDPMAMIEPLPDSATRDGAARAVLVGLRAAWRAPSVVARDLSALLVSPALSVEGTTAGEAVNLSVRVAHRALALLARVRPVRWRAACLHR